MGGAVSLVAHGVTTVSTVVTSMSPMDLVHSALDVVGMIPIIGEAADLLNGVVYLAQGDLGNAALSMVSMVPIVGNTAAGARLIGAVSTAAVATVAVVRNTNRVANVIDEVGDVTRLARQAENALDATVTAEHALDTTTDVARQTENAVNTANEARTVVRVEDAANSETGLIAARDVRFTQDSAGSNFRDGSSVFGLSDEMAATGAAPESMPAIRVFQQDGSIYSLDNRRLFAGQYADVSLPYQWATPAEIAARNQTQVLGGTGINIRFSPGDWAWWQP